MGQGSALSGDLPDPMAAAEPEALVCGGAGGAQHPAAALTGLRRPAPERDGNSARMEEASRRAGLCTPQCRNGERRRPPRLEDDAFSSWPTLFASQRRTSCAVARP